MLRTFLALFSLTQPAQCVEEKWVTHQDYYKIKAIIEKLPESKWTEKHDIISIWFKNPTNPQLTHHLKIGDWYEITIDGVRVDAELCYEECYELHCLAFEYMNIEDLKDKTNKLNQVS